MLSGDALEYYASPLKNRQAHVEVFGGQENWFTSEENKYRLLD